MSVVVTAMMAILAALTAGAMTFAATFAVLASTESCPPAVQVCDAGMVGNFVLAVLAGFLGALVVGILTARWLRDRPSGLEEPPSNER